MIYTTYDIRHRLVLIPANVISRSARNSCLNSSMAHLRCHALQSTVVQYRVGISVLCALYSTFLSTVHVVKRRKVAGAVVAPWIRMRDEIGLTSNFIVPNLLSAIELLLNRSYTVRNMHHSAIGFQDD